MKREAFTFKSQADGLVIHAIVFWPENQEVKGIVQLVHGMCEHKERYYAFMEFLSDKGYVCVIHDHRGHGESLKAAGDLGYMYEGGYEGLILDTHRVTELIKSKTLENLGRELPVYLLGHSMGSLVVRSYLKKYDGDINKLMVVGTPSNRPGAGAGLLLISLLKALKGGKKHSALLDFIVIKSSYEARYKNERLLHAWVNSSRVEVLKYNADPLCNYCFTINGYENLVKLTCDTYSSGDWAVKNPSLPIRFYSGQGDPCAVSSKDFEKCISFLKDRGYTDVEGKMYEGMRHEVLNEPKRMEVYEDILRFLQWNQ